MPPEEETAGHDRSPADADRRRLPKIVWVLPVAAALIVAAILVRQTHGPFLRPRGGEFTSRPAPPITLDNQFGKRLRTERFLGRRKLVVIFYDAEGPPKNRVQLAMLRDAYHKLREQNVEVVGVSATEPPRSDPGGVPPFSLLWDADYAVHRQWGLPDPDSGPVTETVFLVDSTGLIRWSSQGDETPLDIDTLFKRLSEYP